MSPFPLNDILAAYASGLFPMADSAEAEEFFWYDPPLRGQLSITDLHIPARLKKSVLAGPYDVRIDTAFEEVLNGCAAATDDRPKTWINKGIRDLFMELHCAGFAHSVECWKDGALAGGLYGLAIGGFFSGESMFSRKRDASKVALVHLCARLSRGGFSLLDTQFINDHLRQFGAYEISRESYRRQLREAVGRAGDFALKGLTEPEVIASYLIEKQGLSNFISQKS